MLLENKNQVQFPAENIRESENIKENLPYIYNDITTFFTMMVGIYFPSVTGRTAEATSL